MLRFLLSLLALISGLAVPGMAEARLYGPSETEIGAPANPVQAAPAEARHAALIPARPCFRLRRGIPVVRPGLAFAVPAPVLVGIDRARE
ncbi:MAG: hypothetical protein KGN34_02545 [Sphingomonadales bacterium]|nr:hypothetical protein [Sphingomonadales bacterium]